MYVNIKRINKLCISSNLFIFYHSILSKKMKNKIISIKRMIALNVIQKNIVMKDWYTIISIQKHKKPK